MSEFEREEQLLRQRHAHPDKDITVDIALNNHVVLKDFKVDKGVFRPDITTSLTLARWLYERPELYRGKTVLDMGCGSGLQGIVAGMRGASHVTFADKSLSALRSTHENSFNILGIDPHTRALHADLFTDLLHKTDILTYENHEGGYDVIIFNHPFFEGEPRQNDPVSAAMRAPGSLLERFAREAPSHLAPGGQIIMPWYTKADPVNDPGRLPGYDSTARSFLQGPEFIQQGEAKIYLMRPE